jgi:soluble lytic murein transglycosylase-like protein
MILTGSVMVSKSERSQNALTRIPAVTKFFFRLLLVVGLSGLAAVSYLIVRSKDPFYVVREIKNWGDYHRFDALITKVAAEHKLDPRLVKAVVWRESRFQADMVGKNGERGLMQISAIAAREWATANAIPNFEPDQLFTPETNLEIGCWYLGKAMQRWNNQDDAVPFALAEYNAGRSRVDRWIRAASQKSTQLNAQIFEDSIDFPSTAHYVRTILARYDFYKQRGPLIPVENNSVLPE